jgi:isoquinoline 1-oxidoreductase beta subunit
VTSSLNRRTFVKTAAGLSFSVYAGGLISGCSEADVPVTASSPPTDFISNIWVTIRSDNAIEITNPATEMGQGSLTSLPMILVEELDADWSKVSTIPVTRHDPAYGNPDFGGQLYTAGQATVGSYYNIFRFAGAQARRLLLDTAARQWNVPIDELATISSVVRHDISGRSITYGELTSHIKIPDVLPEISEADLKPRNRYRIVGRNIPRLDVAGKVDGSAIFGIDVNVPGMQCATVLRAPVEGATPADIDQNDAEGIAGVSAIVPLANGVGVVGNTMTAVLAGRHALKVTWTGGREASAESSEDTLKKYQALASDFSTEGSTYYERGDVDEAMRSAKRFVDAEYQSDYAYHAQLEPMNATASVNDAGDAAELWVSTQTQTLTAYAAARALGTSSDRITVHPMLIGGGFGRRTHMQYVEDAVLLSKATRTPVKVIWTREDDVKHGQFRPMSAHRLRAGLDDDGKISAWLHRVATPSVLAYFKPERWAKTEGRDVISMKSTDNANYDIPHMRAEQVITERNARIAPFRGIGAGYTKFAIESFLDEIALARQMDPMDLRLELCENSKRMRAVLEELIQFCDWNRPRQGKALGVAVGGYGETMAAGVAEVSVDKSSGKIFVHNFWAVADPGLVIAPDNTEYQLEGAIIFGLSHALKEQIAIVDGVVEQSNYHDFPIMRMSESPSIHVKVFSTDNPPSGIGETGVPLTAAAVANALATLEGIRVRRLPLTPSRVLEAINA